MKGGGNVGLESLSGDDLVKEIIESEGNAIYRLAYSYLKNTHDAEDVLQDTLVQFLKKKPEFESKEHRKAWLLRVASNLSKNRLKLAYRNFSVLDEEIPTTQDFTEEESEVLRAVHSLPAKYRDVIYLFYYEGYHTEEIAGILNKRDATVRSLLSRARKKLKTTLKEAYDFHE